MAGKGGGAWKVAYADFVTAMMAFFLVMWIVAQNKPTKEAVAKYFNDPYGSSNQPGRSNSMMPNQSGGPLPSPKGPPIGKVKSSSGRSSQDPGNKPRDEAEQRSRSPGRAGMAALNNHDRVVGTRVPFDEESATLDDRAKRLIDQLLPELQGKAFKIEVRGHTSGRPLPPKSEFHGPWELSYARGMATMKYLVDNGIQPKRIRLSQSGPFDPDQSGKHDGISAPPSRVEIYALNEIVLEPTQTHEEPANHVKKPDLKRMLHPQGSKTSDAE
jgi:chemotaxis protein MotB